MLYIKCVLSFGGPSVQKQSIPVLLEGRDALVRSQTGSGQSLFNSALPLVARGLWSFGSSEAGVWGSGGCLSCVGEAVLASDKSLEFIHVLGGMCWLASGTAVRVSSTWVASAFISPEPVSWFCHTHCPWPQLPMSILLGMTISGTMLLGYSHGVGDGTLVCLDCSSSPRGLSYVLSQGSCCPLLLAQACGGGGDPELLPSCGFLLWMLALEFTAEDM